MNTFAITLDLSKFETAKKTGMLDLSGIAQRRLWAIAELRGRVDSVVLYCVNQEPYTARLVGQSEQDRQIRLRFTR